MFSNNPLCWDPRSRDYSADEVKDIEKCLNDESYIEKVIEKQKKPLLKRKPKADYRNF